MSLSLYHNSQRICHNSKYTDGHTFLANALVLQLEQGSVVYMGLRETHGLYDDVNIWNTFSGFLLFPL